MHCHKRLSLFLVSATLAALSGTAQAQGDNGFLRGRGKFDIVLSYTEDSYDEFWIGDDKVSPPEVGEVTRESWTLYGAYGLRDDLDLFLSGSYVDAETDGTVPFEDERDLQDAIFGLKWRFLEERAGPGAFSLLLAPSIKQPLGDYENNDVTAIGDGQTDLRGRLIAHYQFDVGAFVALESGYDRRNGAPDDEIPFHATVGATFANLTVAPFYSMVDSQGGYDIGEGSFPGVEEDYTRYGVNAYFRINETFGLTGMWRTTSDGKNTGEAEAFSLGLVFRQ
jgi:hypothetical protein